MYLGPSSNTGFKDIGWILLLFWTEYVGGKDWLSNSILEIWLYSSPFSQELKKDLFKIIFYEQKTKMICDIY